MADPLSVTASALAVITAAVQSTRSLYETIKRFKDRSKILRRLQDELEDLSNILSSLEQVVGSETMMLALLQRPIDRCSQVCHDFEKTIKVFSGKSKPGFRDWTKMEFMKGDINEFIDTIAEYKSTISVGLGTITMHNSKISQQVLQEYNEMIQDTAYNLELRLRRIDEKMGNFSRENHNASETSIDLKDERAVVQQCIRVCEDAGSYIESLINRQSSLLPPLSPSATGDGIQDHFEAQQETRQILDQNQNNIAELLGRLQERLRTLILEKEPNDKERIRLQEDIVISKQCLEVCKTAAEVSQQKIYRVGEVIADNESDQVVVNTLADLFDVKKAQSMGNSAQLVGSMTEEALRHLTEERYKSRFGAFVADSDRVKASSESEGSSHGSLTSSMRRNKPSPNEMKKRAMGGDRS